MLTNEAGWCSRDHIYGVRRPIHWASFLYNLMPMNGTSWGLHIASLVQWTRSIRSLRTFYMYYMAKRTCTAYHKRWFCASRNMHFAWKIVYSYVYTTPSLSLNTAVSQSSTSANSVLNASSSRSCVASSGSSLSFHTSQILTSVSSVLSRMI